MITLNRNHVVKQQAAINTLDVYPRKESVELYGFPNIPIIVAMAVSQIRSRIILTVSLYTSYLL